MSGGLDPSFEEFARQRSAVLLRAAYLLVGDRGDAEDLLQIALLRCAQRWRVASESPDRYVRRVLVHLAIDRWRRVVRRPRETNLRDEIEVVVTDDPGAQLLDRTILLNALRELPPRQRAVVVLRFFEGLSVLEAAATLGCSEGTVKSHSSRALLRLREVLSVEAREVPSC